MGKSAPHSPKGCTRDWYGRGLPYAAAGPPLTRRVPTHAPSLILSCILAGFGSGNGLAKPNPYFNKTPTAWHAIAAAPAAADVANRMVVALVAAAPAVATG